ncbi:hypothetical protein ACIRJR_01680 [Streptomyces sp. NPDC102402]
MSIDIVRVHIAWRDSIASPISGHEWTPLGDIETDMAACQAV